MTAGPYAIGSDHCPGLSKLAEEAGEVVQVVGKIMGAGGMVQHWDGSDLRQRLEEEMADLLAAIHFVTEANSLDPFAIEQRRLVKIATFRKWHAEALPQDPFAGRRAANAVYVPGRRQFVRPDPELLKSLGIDVVPSPHAIPAEWCAFCYQHVSRHYTDGRPTYFCDWKDEP